MASKPKKVVKKPKKKAKKKANFSMKHPLLIPVVVFFGLVFFGLTLIVAAGATTGTAKDTHIVEVYVDGEKQTVSTRADSVDDLIKRLELSLIEEDKVEPSRDTAILEDNTQVNIYRARPVEVVDGNRVVTFLSAEQAPRVLVEQAGVTLLPEDDIEVVTRETSNTDIGLGEQYVIDRSVPVQLNIYGVINQQRTTSNTVGELLSRSGVVVAEGESVQPENLDTPITPNLFISVNKPGLKTEAITEEIPFGTETITDKNLDVGKREVRTAGVNGEQAVVYEIVEENGQETSRRILQTVVTRAPVTQVTVIGAKQATLSSNVNVSADKASIMAAAGISPSDYAYVDFIVQKESRWRPGARNAGSGAYGLCQAVPASKMSSAGGDYLTNPVTQMRWCNGYAQGRYGGWQGAYNAWLAQSWW